MMIRKAAGPIRSEQAETLTLPNGSVLDATIAGDGERLLTLHVNETAGFPGARLEVLDRLLLIHQAAQSIRGKAPTLK